MTTATMPAPDTAATISKDELLDHVRNALAGHELQGQMLGNVQHTLNEMLPWMTRRRVTASEAVRLTHDAAYKATQPRSCGEAPHIVGGQETATAAAFHQHQASCPECIWLQDEAHRLMTEVRDRLIAELNGEPHNEQNAVPDTTHIPEGSILLRCQVCGDPMYCIRVSKKTCSDKCRQRLVTMRKKAAQSGQGE